MTVAAVALLGAIAYFAWAWWMLAREWKRVDEQSGRSGFDHRAD